MLNADLEKCQLMDSQGIFIQVLIGVISVATLTGKLTS